MKNGFIKIMLVLFLLNFSNCGLRTFFKVQDAFQMEYLETTDFKQEIPFELVKGAIIVEVIIGGKPKKFVFDTGATTILDDDLAETLEFDVLGKVKTVDSNRKKQYNKYVRLESVTIGKIPFHNIVASIFNLEVLKVALCADISGILGANVMNKAIWQIDFQNKKIIFTDNRKELNLSGEEEKFNFHAFGKGVPLIEFYMDEVYLGDVKLDTGFNGSFNLAEHTLPENVFFIEKKTFILGIFGEEERTQKVAKLPNIRLGETLELTNTIATFNEKQDLGYIGTQFLAQYLVTIDWGNRAILLGNKRTMTINPYESFGFFPRLVDGKLLVGSIYMDAPIYKSGLRLNDEILKLNELDFKENCNTNYCKYIHENPFKTVKSIKITIQRDGEIMEFEAMKTVLIE